MDASGGDRRKSYFFFKPVFATSQLLAFRIHGSSSSRRIRTHLQHLLPLEHTRILRTCYALHRRRQKRDVLYSIFMINKIDSGWVWVLGVRCFRSTGWLNGFTKLPVTGTYTSHRTIECPSTGKLLPLRMYDDNCIPVRMFRNFSHCATQKFCSAALPTQSVWLCVWVRCVCVCAHMAREHILSIW